ncbi:MAG TPA: glucuronyl hydrolase [Caldilineae bacterium]|jgi:unsaturated chondroitin disaccharide hydrolase|nr:glucuronyl hydrolase [Caldilineae bacterium]
MAVENERPLREALDHAIARITQLMEKAIGFPQATEHGRWRYTEDGGWTGGFWPGRLWLAYLVTEEGRYATAAREWCVRLAPREFDTTTHDLGFLFYPSYVTGYRLTDERALRYGALAAAETLTRRFNPKGNFIQAWGPLDDPRRRGRTIVDTMMNLDLLFWATTQTGENRFSDIAVRHARTCQTHHVRPDGSTAHVYDFNPDTGEPIGQNTHQGYSPTSCWSRGQAWAIYGFTTCYRRTGDEAFLATARKLADWFIAHLPEDHVPYWDFNAPDIPNEVRDSSAAAIAACGLLDLAIAAGEPRYREAGLEILTSLATHYTSRDHPEEEGILLHATGAKPLGREIDVSLTYGDYYFVEGLLRILEPEKLSRAIGLGGEA